MSSDKQGCSYFSHGFNADVKEHIGEHLRSKRVCRFCGKSMPEVSFKKKGHALSESIGNKFIIGDEECDSCNEKFSDIEQHFYKRHAFHLELCGIKGKKGNRKIKSPEMDICTQNGILTFAPHIPIREVVYNKDGVGKLDFSFVLKSHQHIPQNIYKCLVKYSMSVVDKEYLPFFTESIRWIANDTLTFNVLPKVILYSTEFDAHPRVANFIRKSDCKKFPYAFSAVEFTNIGYFFIIPQGNREPINGYMLQNFAYAFKQIFGEVDSQLVDLSSTSLTTPAHKLQINNIILNKTAYNIPLPFNEYIIKYGKYITES